MRILPSTKVRRYLQIAPQTTSSVRIRSETDHDIAQIRDVIKDAFAAKSHLAHQEADIVDSLREAGALSHSVVAIRDNNPNASVLVGHIAVSPVLVNNEDQRWFGLGPLSVRPTHQGLGIGSALVRGVLTALQDAGAAGCVVAGSPKYYQQFSFEHDPGITFEGAPAKYFQRVVLNGPVTNGKVTYHDAFSVT